MASLNRNGKVYYDVEEIAKHFGMTDSYVRRLARDSVKGIAKRPLPVIKVGRRWWIDKEGAEKQLISDFTGGKSSDKKHENDVMDRI